MTPSNPAQTHRNESPSRGRGWTQPRWVLAAIAIVAIAGAVALQVAKRRAPPLRTDAPLAALPDLAGQPAELRASIQAARARVLNPATALAGLAELGRLCHANGFIPAAEACWQVLVRRDAQNPRWSYYLADLRRLASDDAGMVAALRRVTRLDPAYAPAWLRLGDAWFKTGRLKEARGAYERRLALEPKDPYARLGLARIGLQDGRRDQAKQALEELVHDTPGFSPAHNLYAEMLAADGNDPQASRERVLGRQAGRFREAEDPWLAELDACCFDYDRLCIRGTIDEQTKHGDWGRSAFERAIRLRPAALTAYELLGNLEVERGEPAKARETYERGLRLSTGTTPSARFYVNYSRVCRQLGSPTDAVRIAREGLARLGAGSDLYDALGTALGDLGRDTEAVETLRKAVAGGSGGAQANYDLAIALLQVRQLDDALEALHRSLAVEPTFPASLALLAQIEIDSGHWEAAARYLQPLYESHPEVPDAGPKMAYCQLRAGEEAEGKHDLAAAESHYRAGAAIQRNDAELQIKLALVLMRQSRYADAVAPLEAYRRLDPGNPQGALYLGQAYAGVGRRTEAQRVLREGLELAETGGNTDTARHCRESLLRLR